MEDIDVLAAGFQGQAKATSSTYFCMPALAAAHCASQRQLQHTASFNVQQPLGPPDTTIARPTCNKAAPPSSTYASKHTQQRACTPAQAVSGGPQEQCSHLCMANNAHQARSAVPHSHGHCRGNTLAHCAPVGPAGSPKA